MDENRKIRPALILLSRGEKLAGWIYFPFYILLLSLILSVAFMALGRDVTASGNQLYMNFIYGVINFCVLILCFRGYLGKNLRQAKQFPGRFFAAVGVGFLIYYAGTAIVTMLVQLIEPGLENINNENIEAMAGHGAILMVIYAVLLVPTVEELMFRGLVFSSIRPRSRFWAYVVSMVAFSLLHVLGYVGSYPVKIIALCFLQYLPASFGLAWALEFSGSIWASIGVHTLANSVAMLAMLFVE